jgi:hypothetical protein
MERARAFIPYNCASHNHQPYKYKAFACPIRWCYPSSVGECVCVCQKRKEETEEQKKKSNEQNYG